MKPEDTAKNYDSIAEWWLDQMQNSDYGLFALARALKFVDAIGEALDVGCGCEGRFLKLLSDKGFKCTGVDVSPTMISMATSRLPQVKFEVGDICSWDLPKKFDLITAWDSTFHLPLENQEPVLLKLCDGLKKNGVLLFTCGGGEKAGEVRGQMNAIDFEYSTLGISSFIKCIQSAGCSIMHLEYDQYPPENHVYIILKKI